MRTDVYLTNMSFAGRSYIVTGAGQGIGLAICRLLLQQSATVVLNDVDPGRAQSAADTLRDAGGTCIVVAGDASDTDVIAAMIEEAARAAPLAGIVANAGITLFGDFLSYPKSDFMKVMQTNLTGTFFLAQASAKKIIADRRTGSFVFMSSVTGHQAHRQLAAYGMSKAAIEMLARQLVAELSPYGIRTNAVAPGATITERTAADPQYAATWQRITPMGRAATVTDIAETVLFLLSDKSAHITGQSIVVDGGWTSMSPSPYE
jgi:glucose 1-dehydrogenase